VVIAKLAAGDPLSAIKPLSSRSPFFFTTSAACGFKIARLYHGQP
jgi:hypothetical protein